MICLIVRLLSVIYLVMSLYSFQLHSGHLGCVKAPWGKECKWVNIGFILTHLQSLHPGSFHASSNAQNATGRSMGLQAHSVRPSPLHLSKLPSLQMERELRGVTKIKPPLLVQNFSIMIDPGHGGHDIGTQSISKPRYQEKSLNLVTAKFVRDYLQQLGYQVMMTREEDKFVSLERRAKMANERKPILFVSIHYNSAPSAEAQGIEVFFYQSKEQKDRMLKSKHLAQAVLKNVLAQTKAKSRGVKHGNFLVIRETMMPAILIEGGFVTNESELQNLKDPVYLKRLAWGIVRGIEEYLSRLN